MQPYGNLWFVVIPVLTGAMVVLLTIFLVVYRKTARRRYDADAHRAQLSEMRAHFESELNKVTQRLMATEERWLDVNHLLISALQRAPDIKDTPERAAVTKFIQSFGLAEKDLSIQADLVFVLTPFHREFDDAFLVISETCRNLNLRCLRGDEDHITSDLLTHILTLLVKARLVIVNLDGRNPNVFYELGIAHAIDKPTILISSSIPEMPFDIRTRKIVVWSTFPELRTKLQTELARALAKETSGSA